MTYSEAVAIHWKHLVAVSTKCADAHTLPAADSFPYICKPVRRILSNL